MIHLVCGPPCAGKTTLVHRLAHPGDTILDFDAICAELDGNPGWDHTPAVRHRAHVELEHRIAQMGTPGDAWLIRSLPDASHREHLAHHLRATVYLLDPGRDVCLRRARHDHRPTSTVHGIHHWYAVYRPSRLDRPAPETPCPGLAPSARNPAAPG